MAGPRGCRTSTYFLAGTRAPSLPTARRIVTALGLRFREVEHVARYAGCKPHVVSDASTARMNTGKRPPGACTRTSSPARWPRSSLPNGA